MKRTQIQIRSEQLAWLRGEAGKKGVSMAELIRESIDFYQAHVDSLQKRHVDRNKAMTAVGAFSSSNTTRVR